METLRFTVDSALLTELGEKLVETVHLAAIELVKNAYDADAKHVTLRFKESGSSAGPDIELIDDGSGMTLDDVKNFWMRIATTVKTREDKSSKYGRPRTGSKGIGRFSCRRLGTELKLITVAKNQKKNRYERTQVLFPWREYAAGTEVTTIECPGKFEIVDRMQTGTRLLISGSPKDEWIGQGYNYLKRQLAVLVANRGTKREGFEEDPGFSIILEAPKFEGGSAIDLREKLISSGWGTLTARIDERHRAVYTLEALGIGTKTITSTKTFEHLVGATLQIGIIVDRKEQMRDTSVLSLGTLRDQILPEWGGVQVRYKGFRVYPYGDDDWLEIDHDRALRRRQPSEKQLSEFAERLKGVDAKRVLLSLVSMRSHVGSVELDDRTDAFEMKASREGFLDSSPVAELKEFVRYGIDWATIYRDFFLRKKAKEDSEIAREFFEDVLQKEVDPEKLVESAVAYIDKEIKSVSSILPASERAKFKRSVEKATDAILKHEKASKEELQHLRLIASTSTLLLIFSHEVKSLIGSLENDNASLSRLEKVVPKKDAVIIKEIRQGLVQTKKRFSDLLDLTSLIGIDSKNAKAQNLALKERLIVAKKSYQLILNTYDIDFNIDEVPNNIAVKNILEAELYAIVLNILSNSIKSVIAAGGERKIKVAASRENGKTIIKFFDNGLGLNESYFEEVFTPFLADPDGNLYRKLEKKLNPEDKYIVGTGSGLGLGIVKEIVEARNGAIVFRKPRGHWKVELEVTLQ